MNDASTAVAPLRVVVEQCLRSLHCPFTVNHAGNDLRFHIFTDRQTSWRAQIVVHEDERLLQLFVYLTDDQYPVKCVPWIREFAARFNVCVTVLGCFAVGWDNGDVCYRAALDFRRIQPQPALIEDLLNGTAFPIRMWQRAFEHVWGRKVAPQDALNAALIAGDAYEGDGVSNGTRRALFQVTVGSAPHNPATSAENGHQPPRLDLV